MRCKMHQKHSRSINPEGGTELALVPHGGCSMRSLVLVRIPGTVAAVLTAAAAAQLANLSFEIPFHQLQLAWTLTRVLIQL